MLITFWLLSGKTIRSFNAEAEVNDLINESGIKKGELSSWINDKIKKGFLYDKTLHVEIPVIYQGTIRSIKIWRL